MEIITIPHLTIGQAYAVLRLLPPDWEVPFRRGGDSYRGFYDRFAIEAGQSPAQEVADYLTEDVVGKTFTGYKGGEFTMTADTLLYCADYGECSTKDAVGYHPKIGFVLIEQPW
jgi:hypothetical protein